MQRATFKTMILSSFPQVHVQEFLWTKLQVKLQVSWYSLKEKPCNLSALLLYRQTHPTLASITVFTSLPRDITLGIVLTRWQRHSLESRFPAHCQLVHGALYNSTQHTGGYGSAWDYLQVTNTVFAELKANPEPAQFTKPGFRTWKSYLVVIQPVSIHTPR